MHEMGRFWLGFGYWGCYRVYRAGNWCDKIRIKWENNRMNAGVGLAGATLGVARGYSRVQQKGRLPVSAESQRIQPVRTQR